MAHPFFKKRIADKNLVVKRQKKCFQFTPFICADAEEVGIVMVQYFVNGTEPAIVHVGLGVSKVSEAGNLEPVEVAGFFCYNITTRIQQVVGRQLCIPETVVRKQRLTVAAIAFLHKYCITGLFNV